ncbi:hypothetical protein GSI01S_01_02840 [Gordonia sihwensis NBRC 108236]|uniref:Secreted protein n=2 Tax=Gordonia sihwensis TaxID=173559 RepID=L7LGX5_9ACTN|nr:hypothetical protein GSI01S_01_02840 [Gordonia sihwensis NBRC 108236]
MPDSRSHRPFRRQETPMIRTTIAALAALAATTLGAGLAAADDPDTQPAAIVTVNDDGWATHAITDDDDTGYTAPGIEQCPTPNGATAAFTSYTPVDVDENGAPIYATICHYEDVNITSVRLDG